MQLSTYKKYNNYHRYLVLVTIHISLTLMNIYMIYQEENQYIDSHVLVSKYRDPSLGGNSEA